MAAGPSAELRSVLQAVLAREGLEWHDEDGMDDGSSAHTSPDGNRDDLPVLWSPSRLLAGNSTAPSARPSPGAARGSHVLTLGKQRVLEDIARRQRALRASSSLPRKQAPSIQPLDPHVRMPLRRDSLDLHERFVLASPRVGALLHAEEEASAAIDMATVAAQQAKAAAAAAASAATGANSATSAGGGAGEATLFHVADFGSGDGLVGGIGGGRSAAAAAASAQADAALAAAAIARRGLDSDSFLVSTQGEVLFAAPPWAGRAERSLWAERRRRRRLLYLAAVEGRARVVPRRRIRSAPSDDEDDDDDDQDDDEENDDDGHKSGDVEADDDEDDEDEDHASVISDGVPPPEALDHPKGRHRAIFAVDSGATDTELRWDVMRWMSRHGRAPQVGLLASNMDLLREWFRTLDADGSGRVGLEELVEPLVSVGLARSEAEVQALIRAVDEKGCGEITLSEFVALLSAEDLSPETVLAAAAAEAARISAVSGSQVVIATAGSSVRPMSPLSDPETGRTRGATATEWAKGSPADRAARLSRYRISPDAMGDRATLTGRARSSAVIGSAPLTGVVDQRRKSVEPQPPPSSGTIPVSITTSNQPMPRSLRSLAISAEDHSAAMAAEDPRPSARGMTPGSRPSVVITPRAPSEATVTAGMRLVAATIAGPVSQRAAGVAHAAALLAPSTTAAARPFSRGRRVTPSSRAPPSLTVGPQFAFPLDADATTPTLDRALADVLAMPPPTSAVVTTASTVKPPVPLPSSVRRPSAPQSAVIGRYHEMTPSLARAIRDAPPVGSALAAAARSATRAQLVSEDRTSSATSTIAAMVRPPGAASGAASSADRRRVRKQLRRAQRAPPSELTQAVAATAPPVATPIKSVPPAGAGGRRPSIVGGAVLRRLGATGPIAAGWAVAGSAAVASRPTSPFAVPALAGDHQGATQTAGLGLTTRPGTSQSRPTTGDAKHHEQRTSTSVRAAEDSSVPAGRGVSIAAHAVSHRPTAAAAHPIRDTSAEALAARAARRRVRSIGRALLRAEDLRSADAPLGKPTSDQGGDAASPASEAAPARVGPVLSGAASTSSSSLLVKEAVQRSTGKLPLVLAGGRLVAPVVSSPSGSPRPPTDRAGASTQTRQQANAVRELFRDLASGSLGDPNLPFSLLVSAKRRQRLMEATAGHGEAALLGAPMFEPLPYSGEPDNSDDEVVTREGAEESKHAAGPRQRRLSRPQRRGRGTDASDPPVPPLPTLPSSSSVVSIAAGRLDAGTTVPRDDASTGSLLPSAHAAEGGATSTAAVQRAHRLSPARFASVGSGSISGPGTRGDGENRAESPTAPQRPGAEQQDSSAVRAAVGRKRRMMTIDVRGFSLPPGLRDVVRRARRVYRSEQAAKAAAEARREARNRRGWERLSARRNSTTNYPAGYAGEDVGDLGAMTGTLDDSLHGPVRADDHDTASRATPQKLAAPSIPDRGATSAAAAATGDEDIHVEEGGDLSELGVPIPLNPVAFSSALKGARGRRGSASVDMVAGSHEFSSLFAATALAPGAARRNSSASGVQASGAVSAVAPGSTVALVEPGESLQSGLAGLASTAGGSVVLRQTAALALLLQGHLLRTTQDDEDRDEAAAQQFRDDAGVRPASHASVAGARRPFQLPQLRTSAIQSRGSQQRGQSARSGSATDLDAGAGSEDDDIVNEALQSYRSARDRSVK